jgi:hypothetical protein
VGHPGCSHSLATALHSSRILGSSFSHDNLYIFSIYFLPIFYTQKFLPGNIHDFIPACHKKRNTLWHGKKWSYFSKNVLFQCESIPCIAILISSSKNPCPFLLLLILSLQQN